MATITGHTTRANGTILTAAIYNADHVNHVTNAQALNATKMEGATPPVVDGQAVVWNGTSGALLRTGGYVPTTDLRQIIAGTGLTGGGNLQADRTLSVDFASQAEAEAGTSVVDVMSPLRVAQRQAILLASQAEAEAGADNTKTMTPLRVAQRQAILLASQAEAQAGTDNTKTMTPLRTAQAIAVLAPPPINIGALVTIGTGGTDMGVDDAPNGAAFLIGAIGFSVQISCDGGSSYTTILNGSNSGGVIFVKSGVATGLRVDTAGAPALTRVTPTAAAGNVFLRTGAGTANAIRIM